jgi:hypothetical protein
VGFLLPPPRVSATSRELRVRIVCIRALGDRGTLGGLGCSSLQAFQGRDVGRLVWSHVDEARERPSGTVFWRPCLARPVD